MTKTANKRGWPLYVRIGCGHQHRTLAAARNCQHEGPLAKVTRTRPDRDGNRAVTYKPLDEK